MPVVAVREANKLKHFKKSGRRGNNSNMFNINTHSFHLSSSLKTEPVPHLTVQTNDFEAGMLTKICCKIKGIDDAEYKGD